MYECLYTNELIKWRSGQLIVQYTFIDFSVSVWGCWCACTFVYWCVCVCVCVVVYIMYMCVMFSELVISLLPNEDKFHNHLLVIVISLPGVWSYTFVSGVI